MAAQSDMEALQAAWRALAGGQEESGWRTIPVNVHAPFMLLAGRRMPGGEEAVLVGFRNIRRIPDSHLPQGHGFEVYRLPTDPTGGHRLLLALARRTGGSPELFTMMAEDIVRLLNTSTVVEEGGILQRFLARIRAWQDFMDRHKEGVLSSEAELGLFGELLLLQRMIEAGGPPGNILDAWQGPLDGLQDFVFGPGGIEVKTTLSAGGFSVTVSALEQLDEGLCHPLFVAAVRLALDDSGVTLPAQADIIRDRLQGNLAALETLEVRLIQAGLLKTVVERYTRRFKRVSDTILPVKGDFPRLTRANVHPAIRKARYEIDIDLSGATDIGLSCALEILGVI